MVCSYNGIQLNNPKEGTIATGNMDELQRHHAERKKLDTKKHTCEAHEKAKPVDGKRNQKVVALG